MGFLIAMAVIGLLLAALLWAVIERPSRLVLGARGILDRNLRLGWIQWDEIVGAYPPTAEHPESVRVRLRVTERLARRLGRRKRAARDVPPSTIEVDVELAGTDVNAVELLQRILAESSEAAGAAREVPPAGTAAPTCRA